MPDSTDGSSHSEDAQPIGELGHTKTNNEVRARAYSWSFQAEIRLELSAAVFDKSARIDLAKQVITSSLRHEHRHQILHMVAMFSAEDIQRNSEPIILVTLAGYVQFRHRARSSDLRSWLPEPIVSSSWERVPGGLCGNPVFNNYMKRPDPPWIKIFVVGELALNNRGREERKEERKVRTLLQNCKSDSISVLRTKN